MTDINWNELLEDPEAVEAAVVIGPSSLIVDGDVTFATDLNVPAVEAAIARSEAALRKRWPSIEYTYLTPVPAARPRRAAPKEIKLIRGGPRPTAD